MMKMSINQEIMAAVVAERSRERLDSSKSVLEQEVDNFFFWVMEQCLKTISNVEPPREAHHIELSKEYNEDDLHVKNRVWRGMIAGLHDDDFIANWRLSEEQFTEVVNRVMNMLDSHSNYKTECIPHPGTKMVTLRIDIEA